MRHVLKCLLLGAAALFSGTMEAKANTIITFDDLPGTAGVIPNGYAGLKWENLGYANPFLNIGVVSPPKVGFTTGHAGADRSFGGFEASTALDFISAYITSAGPLSVTVIGYADSKPVYEKQLSLNGGTEFFRLISSGSRLWASTPSAAAKLGSRACPSTI